MQNYSCVRTAKYGKFIFKRFHTKDYFFNRFVGWRACGHDLRICLVGVDFYGIYFFECLLCFAVEETQVLFLLASGYGLSGLPSTQCRTFLDVWRLFLAVVGYFNSVESENQAKRRLFYSLYERDVGMEYL